MFYQVFIPGVAGANVDHLRSVGLDDLLSPNDDPPGCMDTTQGPTGGHGQFWSWSPIRGFNPDKHKAAPCVADPERNLAAGRFFWIFNNGEVPTPQLLQRREMFDGHNVPLADGRQWLVPNVTDLPQTYGFSGTGAVIRRPKNEWTNFVVEAEWSINQCLVAMGYDGDRHWLRELNAAALFLAVNYRVNRELLIVSGLINPANVIQILMRATDSEKLNQMVEDLKNRQAGAATPAGSSVSAG